MLVSKCYSMASHIRSQRAPCVCLLRSSQAGEAAASHHAHHGLRPAAVPAPRRARHPGPGPTVSQAVLARGSQTHERHQHTAGPAHGPTVSQAVLARGSQTHERHQHTAGPAHLPQGNDDVSSLCRTACIACGLLPQTECTWRGLSLCVLVTTVSPAQAADPIKMSFWGSKTRVAQTNRVIDGSRDPRLNGKRYFMR